jgi:hypothetical protein
VLPEAAGNALVESESTLQNSRGGAGNIWKFFEVHVRATTVSGRLRMAFRLIDIMLIYLPIKAPKSLYMDACD